MDFSDLARKSAEFVANLQEWAEVAIMKNEDKVVQLNIDQMLKSTKADGSPILPLYSEGYAKKKGFSNPNLKVTGDFHNEMLLTVFGDQYNITSSNFVTPFLENMYGTQIFNLNADSSKKAREMNGATLIDLYIKWLGQ